MPSPAAYTAARFRCRSGRHWWAHVPPLAEWRRPDSHLWGGARYVVHWECQRDGCEVWRHDAIDHNGGLLTRKYDYPAWYKVEADERPSADELRLWVAKRPTDRRTKGRGRGAA